MLDRTHKQDGEQSPPFFVLEGCPTTTLLWEHAYVEANIDRAFSRNLLRLWDMEGYGKSKGNEPLAIVAGGPSLKKTVQELRGFKTVMACGTTHDFLIENGVKFHYSVHADADKDSGAWLMNPQDDVDYLLASNCHDSLFERLNDKRVHLWHLYGGVDDKVFRGEPCIGGGCTVTLRAICIAVVMGYSNLHFFGFDSCFENPEEEHAYDYGAAQTRDEALKPIQVRVGGERVFTSNLMWLVQARHFQEMCRNMGHMFTPTFHGDGMLAEIIRIARERQQ